MLVGATFAVRMLGGGSHQGRTRMWIPLLEKRMGVKILQAAESLRRWLQEKAGPNISFWDPED